MNNQTVKSTGCCEPFNPEPWQDKEITWKDKIFGGASLHKGPALRTQKARPARFNLYFLFYSQGLGDLLHQGFI